MPAHPAPDASARLPDGGPLTYLMVPGLGLGPEDWEPTRRALLETGAKAGRVVVTSLPGYGEPVRDGDPVDPRTSARRLVATTLAPGERTVLLGHSSSCQVVAHAAALAPERVAGLLLVGPTTDRRASAWSRLVLRWLRTAVHETPRQVPSLIRQYRRTGLRHMLRVMDVARHDDITATLDEVRCPVRIVRGSHDRIAPADWCRSLGPTVSLPRGAHMLPITDGARLAREVDAFVRALVPAE